MKYMATYGGERRLARQNEGDDRWSGYGAAETMTESHQLIPLDEKMPPAEPPDELAGSGSGSLPVNPVGRMSTHTIVR